MHNKENWKSWQTVHLHKQLYKKHGKASKCENPDCQYPNPKRFEWALKKGHDYSANKEDYIQLCPSCHRKYDFTEEKREKLRISSKKANLVTIKKNPNAFDKFTKAGTEVRKRVVLQFTLSGEFIREWETGAEAAKALNMSAGNIVNNIKGRHKKAGGFLWKYKEPISKYHK